MSLLEQLRSTLPETAEVSREGHLILGGCDTVGLAAEFGTPLYLFDEVTLRNQCRLFTSEFTSRYSNTLLAYASKAFINRALAVLFKEEGFGLDIVSGGELAIARSVDFPAERIYFHGNNKSREELAQALEAGVGRIVVDNFRELSILNQVADEQRKKQDILLRLSPGIDPHTHAHTTTGVLDSKFGFPMETGQAEAALRQAMEAPNLNLVGLHVHLGSPIFELEPYERAVNVVMEFAARMKGEAGFHLSEFSPGGGFAIQYVRNQPCPSPAEYAEVIVPALRAQAAMLGMDTPRLVVEPGRSMVGRAGVALYKVGASKDIPGLRRYVSLDGGMADNIRPAIYGSQYEAVVANKAGDEGAEVVTLAGKFCESGDLLIRDISLPPLEPGDIVAIPASGAYCLSMASNYNASLKPPVIMANEGQARLIRRRETYEDLMKNDLL